MPAQRKSGLWISATMQNSWLKDTYCGYRLEDDKVRLRGSIKKSGAVLATTAFTLPAGMVPAVFSVPLPCAAYNGAAVVAGGMITVFFNGQVQVTLANPETMKWVIFDTTFSLGAVV
jgi:hypothetical protein